MSELLELKNEITRLNFIVSLISLTENHSIASTIHELRISESTFDKLTDTMEMYDKELKLCGDIDYDEYCNSIRSIVMVSDTDMVERLTIAFMESGMWKEIGRWFIHTQIIRGKINVSK